MRIIIIMGLFNFIYIVNLFFAEKLGEKLEEKFWLKIATKLHLYSFVPSLL